MLGTSHGILLHEVDMKVVAICGSARKNGNTARLLRTVLDELEARGIQTELVELAGQRLRGCTACMKCKARKDRHCSVTDDVVNDCIDKMAAADGILLGSPTYFADLSAERLDQSQGEGQGGQQPRSVLGGVLSSSHTRSSSSN